MDIEYGLFEVLENPITELTATETVLVNFILERPRDVLDMTIQELALSNDTSPSAVTRLCKKLNIKNFKNFKIYLSQSLERERIQNNKIVAETSIYGKFFQDIEQSLENTLAVLDEAKMKVVNKLIHDSETIYVYGIGFSREIADSIFKKWNILGKSVIVIPDRDTGIISVSNSSTKCLFIGISNGGNSIDVTYVMDAALERGLQTVAITNYKNSKMSQRADHMLYSGGGPALPNFASYAVYSQLFAIDMLYLDYVNTYTES